MKTAHTNVAQTVRAAFRRFEFLPCGFRGAKTILRSSVRSAGQEVPAIDAAASCDAAARNIDGPHISRAARRRARDLCSVGTSYPDP